TESLEAEIAKTQNEAKTETERVGALREELAKTEVELKAAEVAAGKTKSGLDKELTEKHERDAAIARRLTQSKAANQVRDGLKERYHAARGRFTSLQELDA